MWEDLCGQHLLLQKGCLGRTAGHLAFPPWPFPGGAELICLAVATAGSLSGIRTSFQLGLGTGVDETPTLWTE